MREDGWLVGIDMKKEGGMSPLPPPLPDPAKHRGGGEREREEKGRERTREGEKREITPRKETRHIHKDATEHSKEEGRSSRDID